MLFVPPPVSRYFIIDLLPGRSFAGHIAKAGFDVYIADFGEPTSEDRFSDLAYYVDGLVRRCVRKVLVAHRAAELNLVGYCLGGTFSLLYAALFPASVARLVLLTTMVDGDVEGGIAWVAHRMGLAGECYDNPRLVPAAEVKSWFEMLAPGSNSQVGRVQDLWDRLDDSAERLRDVRTMASWVDDVVPAPGRCWRNLYRQFGPGRNRLMTGTATVGDRVVDLRRRYDAGAVGVGGEGFDRAARRRGCDPQIVPHAQVMRLPAGTSASSRAARLRPCGSERRNSCPRRRNQPTRLSPRGTVAASKVPNPSRFWPPRQESADDM